MRSGIGNKEYLRTKDIDCLIDLPGVGENLQDHIDYITSHRVDSWELMGSRSLKFWLRAPFELLKYLLSRTGMFSSSLAEGGAFIKTSEDLRCQTFNYILWFLWLKIMAEQNFGAMVLVVTSVY